MDSNIIEKIEYIVRWVDPVTGCIGWKTFYDLYPDGRIKVTKYTISNRHHPEMSLLRCTDSYDFKMLCADIENCIKSATELNQCYDDCDAEIRICRAFGRREIMDRALGNEEVTVGIYILKYLEMAKELV